MAIVDYRYDPFLDVINVRAITEEEHTIPESSPYTIRLNEVPNKADPSTISIHDADGNVFTEVSATPTQGQFWPDYSVTYGDDWNTGTIQFNAADAGKTVYISYNGMGTLVDDRLADMFEMEGGSDPSSDRYISISGASVYDVDGVVEGSGNYQCNTSYRQYQQPALSAGTHTLRTILQQLINASHSHYTYRSRTRYDCSSTADCIACGGG